MAKAEDNDLHAKNKIAKSKTDFVLDSPFFTSILLKLDIQEDTEKMLPCPTMGTDGDSLWWTKEYVEKCTLDELEGVFAHEIMHIVGLHHLRRGKRDPLLWNIACDFAINLIVTEAGFKLPTDICLDQKYEGWEAERIYADLLKKNTGQDGQIKIKMGGQDMGSSCGWILDKKNKDGSELTESQKKAAELEQKIQTEQAVRAHEKQCGNLPGFLKRMIGELNQPKVNWKEALAQFVAVNSKSDFTWVSPNSRYTSRDVYLPRVYKPEIGEVVDLLDASGSVNEKELKEEVSELKGILSAYEGVTLQVIFFDTRATDPIEITEETEIKKINMGGLGGGTDYKPPFKKVVDKQLEPVCIVVLTDGYCDSFPPKPECPVLWVLTQKRQGWKPPFGDTIYMELGLNETD